jgi:hypothetical protein
MAEPRFETGQEVHVVQYHCGVCKKLEFELQRPLRVMAIEPCDDEFEYRIEDARGVHYETKEVCLSSRQSLVRATSAGWRLGTVESPLPDEKRDRDEAGRNTREHVHVTSVFRENPHKHCMEHLEHVETPIW